MGKGLGHGGPVLIRTEAGRLIRARVVGHNEVPAEMRDVMLAAADNQINELGAVITHAGHIASSEAEQGRAEGIISENAESTIPSEATARKQSDGFSKPINVMGRMFAAARGAVRARKLGKTRLEAELLGRAAGLAHLGKEIIRKQPATREANNITRALQALNSGRIRGFANGDALVNAVFRPD